MAWFLYFISVAWISIGSSSILYTAETRNTFKALLSKTNRKVLSALPFGAGILLIVSASASSYPWLIRLFGLIALIKAGFIFANPRGMYDKAIRWYIESMSEQGDRLFGIITVILGTAVLSWIS
jgi:uncharacterized protein YjeT (DUF2065 family)